jgi:hypothetical protein
MPLCAPLHPANYSRSAIEPGRLWQVLEALARAEQRRKRLGPAGPVGRATRPAGARSRRRRLGETPAERRPRRQGRAARHPLRTRGSRAPVVPTGCWQPPVLLGPTRQEPRRAACLGASATIHRQTTKTRGSRRAAAASIRPPRPRVRYTATLPGFLYTHAGLSTWRATAARSAPGGRPGRLSRPLPR